MAYGHTLAAEQEQVPDLLDSVLALHPGREVEVMVQPTDAEGAAYQLSWRTTDEAEVALPPDKMPEQLETDRSAAPQ